MECCATDRLVDLVMDCIERNAVPCKTEGLEYVPIMVVSAPAEQVFKLSGTFIDERRLVGTSFRGASISARCAKWYAEKHFGATINARLNLVRVANWLCIPVVDGVPTVPFVGRHPTTAILLETERGLCFAELIDTDE